MYIVYRHTNKINGKAYVGITCRKPEERWGKDGKNYKSSPHFYSAIQKYGWDNFFHEVLFENCTKDEACILEQTLIKENNLQNKNFGYNIMEGGKSPIIPEDVRKKMSNSMKGNKNGLGKKCSEEKKKKISKSQIGKNVSEETRNKQSIAAKNRHVKCSEEKKKKLSKNYPNKKSVFCIETSKIFESVRDCARQMNLQANLISKVCKNKAKTTGGFHFKYLEEDNE